MEASIAEEKVAAVGGLEQAVAIELVAAAELRCRLPGATDAATVKTGQTRVPPRGSATKNCKLNNLLRTSECRLRDR